MDLQLTLDGEGTLAERLYRALGAAIADGRIEQGERLPSSRELAGQLGVARATVTLVYERLIAEGWAQARPGSGTFAADDLRPQLRRAAADSRVAGPVPASPPRLAPIAYDFGIGIPDAALFPLAAWRRGLLRETDLVARDAHYADPAGHPGLRTAIAHHLQFTRGVAAEPDGVLITDGAQHAFDLLLRGTIRRGDVVAIEDPGYPLVRALLEAHGARVVTMPVDDEGADGSGLPASTRLVYVTPTHQFPTGVVMTRRRRLELLSTAARIGALVVEDDYDSEFRFDGRPLESLHSLDRSGSVAYVGTFSKSLSPALRTGYLVPPARLLERLRGLRWVTGWHGGLATQGALARLLDSGDYAAHLRRARRTYRARRAAILDGIREGRGEHGLPLTAIPSSAGLHICVDLPGAAPGLDSRIVAAAEQAGVRVEPLSRFAQAPARQGLVIGFGAIGLEQIPDGLRLLRAVIRRAAER